MDRAKSYLVHVPKDPYWPDELAATEAEAELRAKQIARITKHQVQILSPVAMKTGRGFPSRDFKGRRILRTVTPALKASAVSTLAEVKR